MKKLFSIVLVLVMFISVIPVSSYANTSKEISFRDIPFGTKYTDVIEAITKEGIELNEPTSGAYPYLFGVSSKDTINVAGYDMMMSLGFIYMGSYKDNIPVEDCVLYSASYRMESEGTTILTTKSKEYKEWDGKLYDLRIKLQSLYGNYGKDDEKEYINKKTKKLSSRIKDYYFYGANGTSVDLKYVEEFKTELEARDIESGISPINIRIAISYEWEKGDKQQDRLYNDYVAAKNGGTGGL